LLTLAVLLLVADQSVAQEAIRIILSMALDQRLVGAKVAFCFSAGSCSF